MSELLVGAVMVSIGYGSMRAAGVVFGSDDAGAAFTFPILSVGGILIGIFGVGTIFHGLVRVPAATLLILSAIFGVVGVALFIGKRAGGAA